MKGKIFFSMLFLIGMANVMVADLLPFKPEGFMDPEIAIFGSAMDTFGDEINNNYRIISIKRFSLYDLFILGNLIGAVKGYNKIYNETIDRIFTNELKLYIKDNYEKYLKSKYPDCYYIIDNVVINPILDERILRLYINANIIYLIKK